MVNNNNIAYLQSSASKAKASLQSLDEIICSAKQIAQGDQVEKGRLKKIQKQAILDSFTVKKFHRDFKEWENMAQRQFVDTQVKAYNKKYAQISRLHSETLHLEETLSELRSTILLPQFHFSIQTLQHYEDGKLLEHVAKDEKGQYPSTVSTDQIFSLDPNSTLPHPTYQEFNKLVNIEYRLRMQLQIKYEVLLRVKANLAAKNSQWATRDSTLNQFITRDLPKVIDEVKKIKTSEYEDLKYYEEDFDMEDEANDELGDSGTEAIPEEEDIDNLQKEAVADGHTEEPDTKDQASNEEDLNEEEADGEGKQIVQEDRDEEEEKLKYNDEQAILAQQEADIHDNEPVEQVPASADDMILD